MSTLSMRKTDGQQRFRNEISTSSLFAVVALISALNALSADSSATKALNGVSKSDFLVSWGSLFTKLLVTFD